MAFSANYTATVNNVTLSWSGATAGTGESGYTNVKVYRGLTYTPTTALTDSDTSDGATGRQIASAAMVDEGVLATALQDGSSFTLLTTVRCTSTDTGGSTYNGTYIDSNLGNVPVTGEIYVYVLVDGAGNAVIVEGSGSTDTSIKGVNANSTDTLSISSTVAADAGKTQQVTLQNKKAATKFNIDALGSAASGQRICLVAVALDNTADYSGELKDAIAGLTHGTGDNVVNVCKGVVLIANESVDKITLSDNTTVYKPILSGSVQLLYK